MPPKQQSKAELAKKQKVVEDKTFGLKNKNKSKNVQKYVQSLQQAVQPKPDAAKAAAKASSLSVCVFSSNVLRFALSSNSIFVEISSGSQPFLFFWFWSLIPLADDRRKRRRRRQGRRS